MKAAAVDEDTGITQEPLEARKHDQSSEVHLTSPSLLAAMKRKKNRKTQKVRFSLTTSVSRMTLVKPLICKVSVLFCKRAGFSWKHLLFLHNKDGSRTVPHHVLRRDSSVCNNPNILFCLTVGHPLVESMHVLYYCYDRFRWRIAAGVLTCVGFRMHQFEGNFQTDLTATQSMTSCTVIHPAYVHKYVP